MGVREKMRPVFAGLEGGLFSSVSKADVGGVYGELMRQGVTLMGWADPFFPDPSTPEPLIRAAVSILEDGRASHYTMPIGDEELKREIAAKLERENHLRVDPLRNIIITPGSDSGLLYAMMPFIEEGDEVLTTDPSYPSNFLDPALLGGKAVSVPLKADEGYALDIEAFQARVTERTKMVLLTNPNNPTGVVHTREELSRLAEFIIDQDLVCVVDQAFESTIFDGREMVTMASLPGMWERTVTVFSISKGMGLSGFRVGYLVADDAVMDVLYGAAVNVLGATNTLSQRLAVEAFRNPGFIEDYNEKHDIRRKYAYEAFRAVPGVSLYLPQSGFLCWVDIHRLGDSSEIVEYLIREAKVACNDGKAYGSLGAGHLRIVIGCCLENGEAFDAIDRICAALKKRAECLGIQ